MSQYQYFIPGVPVATADILHARGLCSLVKNVSGDSGIAKLISRVTRSGGRGVSNGPGGQNGVIVSDEVVGYYPQQQKWVPAPIGDAETPPYWVGFNRDALPTVADLAREDMLTGKPVTFRNGSTWQVPVLREWQDGGDALPIWSTPLPLMVDIDRYGRAIDGPVVPEYRDLFDVGLKILIRLITSKDPEGFAITNDVFMQFAADALGCNYRVSLLELSSQVMDCLSTDDAIKVVKTAIDLEGYKAALGNWAGRQGRPDTDTDAGSAA